MVDQGGTTAAECLEIDGLIIRGAILPTPKEETAPVDRQSAHGGLMRVPLVALLRVIDPRPEGMPDRFGCPLDARVPEELWTREAPGHPGLLAAAFSHRRDPRICLQCGGGGIAFPWFAEGDEQPGGDAGARAWEGLEQGEIGMALSALRAGVSTGLERRQGDAELVDQGLDEQGLGGDDALIGGQGHSGLDGVETRVDDVRRAHMVVAEEGRQGGAARELRGFEGRPATAKGTKDAGVGILKPLENVRQIVLQSPGEAVGEPHLVADHAAAMGNALFEGAHRGALRREWRQRITVGEPQCERECSVRGVVFGPAGREGFAVPRQRQWIDGKEHQKVILAQSGAKGTFVQLEAEGKRLAVAPRAEPADPCVDGLGRGLKHEGRSFGRASGLEADSRFGLGPVDANKGSKCVG
jgi:hypothetical protein